MALVLRQKSRKLEIGQKNGKRKGIVGRSMKAAARGKKDSIAC